MAIVSLTAMGSFALDHCYVVLVAFIAASYVVYQRVFSPLARIPGPFWASLSRGYLVYHAKMGTMDKEMRRVHSIYGPMVRTAPTEVSVADLNGVKMIYGAGSKFWKSDWYSVLKGRRTFDPFAEQNEFVHAAQKKLVVRPYARETLMDLQPYVDNTIIHFLERMEEKRTDEVDLGKWVQLFAFDVIGEITFSKRFGFMDTETDDGSLKSVEHTLQSASWVGQIPFVFWTHDYLKPYIGNWLGVTNRTGSLMVRALKEVEERKVRGTDRNDILEKLFNLQREKPDQVTEVAVISMAAANITAGTDTTAISLRSIFYHLLKNPQHMARLIEELDEAKRQGALSDPVSMEEADRLPWLQACIYEGLRIHPAIGMNLPRVVPAGGAEIGGYYLPEGTIVGSNAWVIHRDRSVYGEDAEEYNPERWLKRDKGEMQRYFLTFGGASRLCMGKNISFMEMTKLIPTFLQHYELELAHPEIPMTHKTFFFSIQDGLIVRLKPRKTSSQYRTA